MRANRSSLTTIVNMPKPDQSVMDNNENRLLIDERNYNRDEQRENLDKWLRMSTDEQRSVYLEIIEAVNCNKGGMFFVHGFGGTGKTFLWSILGADIRSRGDIVLNVASSGIAALLMEGGRTAHSRFGIPIHVDEFTICSIDGKSHVAELIREAKLIIWDEAPMMNKFCFETLDRSMRDIMKCDKIFGGKVFVLGGDFRQILPVVPEAGRVGTVLTSINSSLLWDSCKVFRLTQNMRLCKAKNSQDADALSTFSKWLLHIGDGKINEPNNGEVEIEIPEDLLIVACDNPIQAIVKQIYGPSFATRTDAKFFCERAILSPRNDDVDKLNQYMLSQLPDVCACIMDVEDRRRPASIIDINEVVLILLNGRCETVKYRLKDNHATEFRTIWQSSGCHLIYKSEPVFCVMRFMRIGEYEGSPCLENTLDSSKIFIKPEYEGLEHHQAM
ncbi:PREDICTED: ATP-dependent DNA helicase PIF2-like [Camelina sativa]|uniref:ATP-dependent DNA helicase n=1 Tax=Camelina sativa TaxID=90675 RepID=A0ABM0WB51_CAMSA|nr:PREDICTED: ATP-dependent DNA helicase PIF2-like [Camelina sativa]